MQIDSSCYTDLQAMNAKWSTRDQRMYEEAQLYSPVTTDASGEVTVHLAHDHPGANDPEYRRRRSEIAAAALRWRPGQPAPVIDYTEQEHEVWRTVSRELAAKHERYAVAEYREAKWRVGLPTRPRARARRGVDADRGR